MSQMSLEKRFGQSAVFVASTLMENGGVPPTETPENLLKEAIHVISCGYEDKSDWGIEVLFFILTPNIKLQYSEILTLFILLRCLSPDWMDLWFCDRRYSNWVQNACPWMEIHLLYAKTSCFQRVCSYQSFRSSEPSAEVGSRFR